MSVAVAVAIAVAVRDGVRQRGRGERRRHGGGHDRPENESPSPHEFPSPGCGTVYLPQESLPGHARRVGGEPVKTGLRSYYSPLGRAAPKKRPPSDFTKPIRSYMTSSVGSDARRAFSAPTASSRCSSRSSARKASKRSRIGARSSTTDSPTASFRSPYPELAKRCSRASIGSPVATLMISSRFETP